MVKASTPDVRDDWMQPAEPHLSVIVLTRNEENNVEDAVRSLLSQGADLEVLVVDSASVDATVEKARRLEAAAPEQVRLIASPRDIPIGEARNLGIAHAKAKAIAFMSADATAAPGWAPALLLALETADVVYGRQEHTPPRLTVAAITRGLRYHHFPHHPVADASTYASNVNAGIRREVFDRIQYVDEGPASALDDVLFTREAQVLRLRIAYEPRMLVGHKDASTLAQELRKNRREGFGWGILAPQLGLHRMALIWGAALVASLMLLLAWPGWPTLLLLAATAYAPTMRRVLRAGRRFLRAPAALAGAILASPIFDLAFLFDYLRGLRRRRSDLSGIRATPGA